ncbi:MAG TPA: hypothetical protein VM223_07830 [Planctomycetota bacterium]|nr:hypothetical protein [Planctomycetota bacterium]
MNRQAYIDTEHNVFEIKLTDNGVEWATFRRRWSGYNLTLVASGWLPKRETAEQAQADLDIFADNAGLRKLQTCRVCGCTDDNCRGCIERTGGPCHWVEVDLCSACAGETEEGNN